VKRVVVAGGGTAGWIAAYALIKQLAPLIEVTLVESDEIGTVGVGESTIPTCRTFHQYTGIDEREFMRATNSTFKLGISFENWAAEQDRYIHSFGTLGRGTWLADFQPEMVTSPLMPAAHSLTPPLGAGEPVPAVEHSLPRSTGGGWVMGGVTAGVGAVDSPADSDGAADMG